MSITLVATDWSGRIPGFDAEQASDCAFMHDPTVRAWIAEQRAKGTPDEPVRVLVADDEWVNPGGTESLTFAVDLRDMEAVEDVRRVLKPPPSRTPAPGGGSGPRGASLAQGPGNAKANTRPPIEMPSWFALMEGDRYQ